MPSYGLFLRGQQVVLSFIYVAYLISQFFAPDPPMLVAPIHVFMSVAVFFSFVYCKSESVAGTIALRVLDTCMVLASLLICAHFYFALDRLQVRLGLVDEVFLQDQVVFVIGTLMLLEAVRRVVGWSLLSVILIFLFYALLWRPGTFSTRTVAELIERTTELVSMTSDGLFGITSMTAVNPLFYFILFGAIFSGSGGGKVFINIAMAIAGRMSGGAPKAAIVASALFGTISGSAVANATTTGVLTIPLMRRSGYSAVQAAATEALTSTGGQLMPPVMGIAAFVMADMLGIPYTSIALAGIIPALSYYFALFLIVDLRARRSGIGTIDPSTLEKPDLKSNIHLLLGPVSLLGMLFMGYSAQLAAFYASIFSLLIPFLRRNTWYDGRGLFNMFLDVARQMATITVPLAAIGIIMVVATQSGMALKFAGLLADLGSSSLYLSLILVILGCLVMGMGLPTVAAYIIGAVMFVPALTKLGVTPLQAHFFVMYYSVLSMVTPPVALASYASAAVAKADAMKTGFLAFGLSAVVFLIPFGFVADPRLLGLTVASDGNEFMRIASIGVACAGLMGATFAWSVFIQGWLGKVLNMVERGLFLAIAVGIVVEPTYSLVWNGGIIALAGMSIWCYLRRERSNAQHVPALM
ncbi:MAG: TRAP transporter fused permease subunit [Formivibrio sp.]|nr:TRAP transporter fused permease subunit [Formivibrio sp.]